MAQEKLCRPCKDFGFCSLASTLNSFQGQNFGALYNNPGYKKCPYRESLFSEPARAQEILLQSIEPPPDIDQPIPPEDLEEIIVTLAEESRLFRPPRELRIRMTYPEDQKPVVNEIQQFVGDWDQWLDNNRIHTEADRALMKYLTDILSNLYNVKYRKKDYLAFGTPHVFDINTKKPNPKRLSLLFIAYKLARQWEDSRNR